MSVDIYSFWIPCLSEKSSEYKNFIKKIKKFLIKISENATQYLHNAIIKKL